MRTQAGRLSWVVDVGVAFMLVVVFWARPVSMAPDTRTVIAGVALASAVAVASMARWHLPTFSPCIALLATGAGWALHVNTDPMLAVAWCLYPLALRRGAHSRAIGLAAVAVMILASLSTSTGADQRPVIAVAAIGGSWLLGHVEARRLDAVRHGLEQQAAYERAMQQTEMAREVHDVVGHALSVITAEADVARNTSGNDPEALRASLADIEQRSRSALEQVQRLVRDLRAGAATDAGPTTLTELVTAARASGLEVHTPGELPTLPRALDVVLSRVLQEALSNVVRHAGARSCTIATWRDRDMLTVQVEDDGSGLPPHWKPGSGLTGMRERVTSVGGTLAVTSRAQGGTRICARLPLEATA